MINTMHIINNRLYRAAGENCALAQVATESVQNEAQTTPVHTKYDTA